MLSNKKAQGMSLNTVIIAIIVLVVLVVLVMIFTGYFGKVFTPGVQSCVARGGVCEAVASCDTTKEDRIIIEAGADKAGKAGCTATEVCCRESAGFSQGSQI